MSELSEFISTVGFPIVVSVAMFYQNNVLSKNYQALTQEVERKMDSNTQVITRLIEKLDQDEILNRKGDNDD